MQLARTLRSQATGKKPLCFETEHLEHVIEGGLPGPTVERGLPEPSHTPACEGPARLCFFLALHGPVSSELAVGCSQMEKGDISGDWQMTSGRTTEL